MTGDEFRSWRERHRMTQHQTGALHCVDERVIRRWEAAGPSDAPMDPRSILLCAAWDWLLPDRRKQLLKLAQRQK
ncbi:hypothetical protein [Azospirillum rugosum]|uniref:XRE family transcriptional regulator n=1 Tax=Azospirillum rugosum TaxID=416170 RepID=A0ABS4SDS0_9PROT|nr:hypothetical protein [Azospirillum rugosum]MBP2290731.1 hypothetical protein [Azospirillum rugosum]MDQ0525620.1 hypothetical protein [Azospirillum rugosum]